MMAFTIHGFGFYIGVTFWALYAQKGLLLAIASVGIIQSVRFFGLWLGAVPSGKLTDMIGGWAMIALHIILTTPTTILHVLIPSYELALINSFIYGLIGAFDGPARPVVYAKMVGEENMGVAVGITDSFIMLGRMGGPIIAGVIWSSMGMTMPFWISGLINMISLIPLYISWRLDNQSN
jgi:MFS family permease